MIEAGTPKPSDNEAHIPGIALIHALWNKRQTKSETAQDVAKHLGITYVYLMALSRGERPISKVDRSVLNAAAEYLEIPLIHVYMLAELLTPADFVYAPSLKDKFAEIHKAMLSDPVWHGYALTQSEWNALDLKPKMLISLLFERAARTQFFSGQ